MNNNQTDPPLLDRRQDVNDLADCSTFCRLYCVHVPFPFIDTTGNAMLATLLQFAGQFTKLSLPGGINPWANLPQRISFPGPPGPSAHTLTAVGGGGGGVEGKHQLFIYQEFGLIQFGNGKFNFLYISAGKENNITLARVYT